MQKQEIFPDIIATDIASGNILSNILKELEDNKGHIISHMAPNSWSDNITSTFVSCKNIIEELGLNTLKFFLDTKVSEYLSLIPFYSDRYKTTLIESWVNVSSKNNFQDWHTHETFFSVVSGVFYIQTNGQDGDLIFSPGFENHMKGTYIVRPQVGKLVLFEGRLPHRVAYNKSNSERVSLSFNYKIENK